MTNVLVTGGAGYFGEVLSLKLLERGHRVRVLDLNRPAFEHAKLEVVQGDIRDETAVRAACAGIDVIHHNVAKVPLAKEPALFRSVNLDGTRILLTAAREAGAGKLVYTSSSAVFGAPKAMPVTAETVPSPAEAYGRAKYEAEGLCQEAASQGLDVSIVRPRTILGYGRLGIFQILFDWVRRGDPVPVFNGGGNRYQFVHADDLAEACIAAGFRAGPGTYNVGSARFGTMRDLLASLIAHAGSTSKIVSVPMAPTSLVMDLVSALGLSPLGPYHALMFGREMFFDISEAERDLDYRPRFSDLESLCQSYDHYITHQATADAAGRSHHQTGVKKRLLAAAPLALRLLAPVTR